MCIVFRSTLLFVDEYSYVPSAVTTPAEVLAIGIDEEASAGSPEPAIAAPAAATAPASTDISWKTPCRVVAGLSGWSVILGKARLCNRRVDAVVRRAKSKGDVIWVKSYCCVVYSGFPG